MLQHKIFQACLFYHSPSSDGTGNSESLLLLLELELLELLVSPTAGFTTGISGAASGPDWLLPAGRGNCTKSVFRFLLIFLSRRNFHALKTSGYNKFPVRGKFQQLFLEFADKLLLIGVHCLDNSGPAAFRHSLTPSQGSQVNAHIPEAGGLVAHCEKKREHQLWSTKLWKGYLSKHSATMYIRIRGMSGRFLVRLAGLQCIYLLPPKHLEIL